MNVTRRNFLRGSAPRSILVVEGDIDLALALTRDLKAEGYVVESIDRGDEAARRLIESPPDLVILDWMLWAVSGPEICIRLRAREATRMLPIILLSERSDEVARLRGFSAGADDFVAKPFSTPELMARVRALLRRSRPDLTDQLLIRGDLELNLKTRRARRGLRDLRLSPTEFGLLECLLERPGRVFAREQLLDRVWGQSFEGNDRTVDVHVGRMRKVLSRRDERDPIRTVRGVGYSFDETFGK